MVVIFKLCPGQNAVLVKRAYLLASLAKPPVVWQSSTMKYCLASLDARNIKKKITIPGALAQVFRTKWLEVLTRYFKT